MPLDMTGEHRHNRGVHYRRYLSHRSGPSIIVICVQNFDYPHYEPSRFVDLQSFTSEDEGRLAPLGVLDVVDQMRHLDPGDTLGYLQGQRILTELDRNQYRVP